MTEKIQVNLRLPEDVIKQLKSLAQKQKRSVRLKKFTKQWEKLTCEQLTLIEDHTEGKIEQNGKETEWKIGLVRGNRDVFIG